MTKNSYRGYVISPNLANATPDRNFDWMAHLEHADPPVVTCYGRSLDKCKADIDREIDEAA